MAVSLLQPLAAGSHIATVTFSASGAPNRTLQVTVDVYQDDHANTRDQATAITAGSAVAGNIAKESGITPGNGQTYPTKESVCGEDIVCFRAREGSLWLGS